MHTIIRRSLAAALAVAATGSLAVAPASAAPPAAVHIRVETLFAEDTVPFTASGAAVDAGLLCASGDVTTTANRATGGQGRAGLNFHVDKLFVCADGTVTIRLQARLDRDGVGFRWVVLGGTGAYATTSGSGSGTGSPLDNNPDGVLDVYDGALVG